MTTEPEEIPEAPALPVAVITGGAGDLATAIARQFPPENWQVHAPSRQELDVTLEESVAAYFNTLSRLDLLVCNAGAIDDRPLPALTEENWNRIVAVNLSGAFLSLRAALPLLCRQGGRIILIGSRAGRRGGSGNSHYAAGKAGLIGLAQSVAKEHGADNVRCNVVLPGFLDTKMTADLPTAVRENARAQHLLGRFNTVEDAARGIAFVASLDHVSGQVFQFDSRVDRWT